MPNLHHTDFDRCIAPLSREEFYRLPLDERQAAWTRYLALVDTKEVASAISPSTFSRSTGPMMRCFHAGCENFAGRDHWYCIEHRAIEESMSNLEAYGALSYGDEPHTGVNRAIWSVLSVVGLFCCVYLMILLWGLVHGVTQ